MRRSHDSTPTANGGELPPPFAAAFEHTSRYGPLFWSALVVGGAFMAFGLVSLFAKAGATRPANFAVFFIGLALVHDLVVAPSAILVASGIRRASPRAGRGLLVGSLVVSVIVVAFSVPMLLGWGAQADNPSFLPRNYAFGVAIVLAVVWVVATAMAITRSRRR